SPGRRATSSFSSPLGGDTAERPHCAAPARPPISRRRFAGAPMNRLASPAQLRASFLRWALFVVPAVMLLGFLSGQVAGSTGDSPWFMSLEKPATFPPPATFGVVW